MMTATRATRDAPPGPVSAVSVPADARALSTLSRIDYEDAFLVDAGVKRTPEQWVRAVVHDAPLVVRMRLVAGWLALGLKLGPSWSASRALGWKVQYSDPGFVLLAADSWLGLQVQLLFRGEPRGLLFATFVQHNNQAAHAVWAKITQRHQQVVRSLLAHAARREAIG